MENMLDKTNLKHVSTDDLKTYYKADEEYYSYFEIDYEGFVLDLQDDNLIRWCEDSQSWWRRKYYKAFVD